jgi:hypothetical protein
MLFTTSLLFALSAVASAQMLPLTPNGVTAGKQATAEWTVDKTGAWKDVTMTLMTGDNFQMVPLTSTWRWQERVGVVAAPADKSGIYIAP